MASINLMLPDDTLEIIERERASTGETQSEFFVRLIGAFANQQKEAEDIERYRRGYEQHPETEEEMAWIEAAQKDAFPADYWDDDYAKMNRGEIPYDDNHPLADASKQTEE